MVIFILKVLILSTVLSVLIKYAGPLVPMVPTNSIALMLVFLPTAIVVLALWRRGWQP